MNYHIPNSMENVDEKESTRESVPEPSPEMLDVRSEMSGRRIDDYLEKQRRFEETPEWCATQASLDESRWTRPTDKQSVSMLPIDPDLKHGELSFVQIMRALERGETPDLTVPKKSKKSKRRRN